MKNLFKVFSKIPLIPKIVIGFECNGCMAHIHDFLFIGYVTKEWTRKKVDMYTIRIIKKGTISSDIRDENFKEEEDVYQIQHLFANLYAFYR